MSPKPGRVLCAPGEGILPLCWVIWMCRGFDPPFDILGMEHDLFGLLLLITNTKTIFWDTKKLPILKNDN